MIITECYLYNFGRFKNFRLALKSGLNCISANNGYGKTTICDFIRIMLFGMRDTKRSGIIDNDRRHYLPWSGERCAGTLSFTLGGTSYRIERTFGRRGSEDTLAVYDVSTGLITDEPGDCPGEWALGVSVDTFERTVFMSDRDLSVSSDNRAISEKISNAGSSDGSGTVNSAIEALEEQRRYYYKRGGSGEIAELKSQIASLDREIGETESKRVKLAEYRDELGSLNSKINETEKLISYSRSDYERARLSEIRKTFARSDAQLRESISRDEARLSEITGHFGGRVPSLLEVSEKLCDDGDNEAELPAFFENGSTTPEEAQGMLSIACELESVEKKKTGYIGIKAFLITIGLSLAIIGIACATTVGIYMLALAALGGITLSVGALLPRRRSISRKDAASTEGSVREFVSHFPCPPGASLSDACRLILESCHMLEAEKKKARSNSEKEASRLERELVLEYSYLTDAVRRKREELDELTKSYGRSEAYAYRTTQSAEDIMRRESSLKESLSALEGERALLKRSVEVLEGELGCLDELESERAQLKKRLDSTEERLRIILKTKEILLETAESMATGHLGSTTESFKGYLRSIDEALSAETSLDTSFEVKRIEYGSTHPSDAYSRGIRDLYEFSTKLAVSDAAFTLKRPPLILDDPFVYLDDDKLKRAKELLYSLARERQVIYFTASKFRGV